MPHHRQGFPCCSLPPLPCVPPPIPRRDQPVRLSLTSRPVPAFPNVPAGRLPHSRFRGLLSVHSRCSPHGRWIALGDPFHRSASNDVVTSIIRSDCYRLERQFAGRVSHPLRDGAFPRHTVRNQEEICSQGDLANFRNGVSFTVDLKMTKIFLSIPFWNRPNLSFGLRFS